MSQQMPDPFIWNNEEWTLIGAENIYSLFDPEEYGLSPDEPATICWKGFIIKLKVVKNHLVFDKLSVYCKNNIYPPINGVKPKHTICSLFPMEYRNINLKLPYSGIITIGKKLNPHFYGRAFTGAHCYETTYELTFKDGKLIESKDTSGTYFGI